MLYGTRLAPLVIGDADDGDLGLLNGLDQISHTTTIASCTQQGSAAQQSN